jgi:hypothetical protein
MKKVSKIISNIWFGISLFMLFSAIIYFTMIFDESRNWEEDGSPITGVAIFVFLTLVSLYFGREAFSRFLRSIKTRPKNQATTESVEVEITVPQKQSSHKQAHSKIKKQAEIKVGRNKKAEAKIEKQVLTANSPDDGEFGQSKKAIIVRYVLGRWLLIPLTMGIIILIDRLNYRNTKLLFEVEFLVFVTGAITTNSKEIPYEDIKNVRVRQSIIGKWFNYGSVVVSMKESGDAITFRRVDNPELVRKAVQSKYVKSNKVKLA